MTKSVQLIAAQRLNLRHRLDNSLFNHISYVTSRLLAIARTGKLGREEKKAAAKLIWRLANVLLAYQKKRAPLVREDVLELTKQIASVFGGN